MRKLVLLLACVVVLASCAPKVKLFGGGADEPLRESVLDGSGPGKVALIDVRGFLGTSAERGMLSARPSVVQEVTSRLKLAEADPDVGALILMIDSPGGTATASDILYHEVTAWRERTHRPVVAMLMDVAA
ncbi:MAG: signal peptide peptidase SppA, partial [Desulfovibrionaceae bacterium]